ncbi:MAG TPA: VWA domain-containing protein, partial [Vicinamibacterales bacterium]|nr:VWA domain-containing protein [Vicinamibacterales bacterium]
AISHAVHDWSGGTRIGSALRAFNQRWARQVLTGGPVVLLISDGWDRGEPIQLAREIARLRRSCHRLVWLNPLIGTENYAPLTRGLQAALPFVDDFLPARTLTDFADLASHLNALARAPLPARAS